MNNKIEQLEKQLAVEKFKVALADSLLSGDVSEFRITKGFDEAGNTNGEFTISVLHQKVHLTRKQLDSFQDFLSRLVDASLTDELPKERRRKVVIDIDKTSPKEASNLFKAEILGY